MKRIISILAIITTSASFILLSNQQIHAVSASDWNAGNIITDSLFYDNNSMSVDDIQNYLNAKNPNCDTWGTKSASDVGYPNLTHVQYAQLKGLPGPPYICLKDYYQVPRSDTIIDNFNASATRPSGSMSAAQIIKAAADTYGVSPKTLIVLLQKESKGPLPVDSWPLQSYYKNAMGYACPDTAPCDPQYAGFYNQMTNAAKRINTYKQNSASYRHKPFQSNSIYYNPGPCTKWIGNTCTERNIEACGKSNVYVENYATAGLYNYTPYQPNKAALDNMYGTGDGCSAYGNRNFWRLYNDWFGPTQYEIRGGIREEYDRFGGSSRLGSPLMNEYCGLKDGACYQNFQKGSIYWTPSQNRGYTVIGGIQSKWNLLGKEWSSLGYPMSNETYGSTNVTQKFQNGIIHYSVQGTYQILSMIDYSTLGSPSSDTICGLKNGGCYQFFSGNPVYWSPSTSTQRVMGAIGAKWSATGKEWGSLGYPTSSEIYSNSNTAQKYEYGDIIYANSVAYYTFPQMKYLSNFTYLGNLRSDSMCGLKDSGCYQLVGNGYIYQSPSTGAHAIFGGILEQWSATGKEWGSLGYPTSSEYYDNGRVVQTFQKGTVYWTPSKISVTYN